MRVNVNVSRCFAFCSGTNGDIARTNEKETAGSTCDPDVQ